MKTLYSYFFRKTVELTGSGALGVFFYVPLIIRTTHPAPYHSFPFVSFFLFFSVYKFAAGGGDHVVRCTRQLVLIDRLD